MGFATYLIPVALSLVYVEIKNWAVRKIPSTEELKEAWSEWEVRCLVALSLILQLLLILSAHLGQRYKGRFSPCVAAFVWSVYLAADWVAPLSMTTIPRGTFEKESAVIVLRTPFLLWHLGSPANITAYSLEDNELWLRHCLGVASNTVEAVYIYVRFRTARPSNYGSLHHLDFMFVPLIGGILKYGDRIVALRCASSEQLQSALYSEAEDSLNHYSRVGMIRTGMYDLAETVRDFFQADITDLDVKLHSEAHVSFEIFRPLFLDLPFEISEEYNEYKVFLKDKSAADAFRLVNVELQFLYDLFFTKNPIQHRHRKLNGIFRSFYILSALYVLIALSATAKKIADIKSADMAVTQLLLVVAIFLDAYASVLHLWSNFSMIRFGIVGPKVKLHKLYDRYWLVASRLLSIKYKVGIPKIAQYDVLKDFSLKPHRESIFTRVINLIDNNELLKKFDHLSWVEVDHDLKKFIYSSLEQELRYCNAKLVSAFSVISNFLSDDHMDLASFLMPDCSPTLKREIGESKETPAGLTRAIFICHIATKLVYYNDLARGLPVDSSFCRISNVLSDYMLYLVLVHPSMLPTDFGEITKESFLPAKKRADLIKRASNNLASRFFKVGEELNPTTATKLFATAILGIQDTEIFYSSIIYGDLVTFNKRMNPENLVIIKGHKFAHELQLLGGESRHNDEKWLLLSDMWTGMMIHAAKQCSWKEHALVLRQGGELLTYVSLLMAHFGLSNNIHLHEYIPEEDFNI